MATPKQLLFQFLNRAIDGEETLNVIYITNDRSYNKLAWQIVLNTDEVTLTPAPEIIDPSQLPPSEDGTLIYLDLSPLNLSKSVFSQLSFNSEQWNSKLFTEVQIVGITPVESITLTSGVAGMQSITVDNMEVTQASVATVNLLTQVYDQQFSSPYSSFAVALQNAPSGSNKNLQDFIQLQLSNDNILNSSDDTQTVFNSTDLIFKPGAQSAQVLADKNTVFNVSFVYGQAKDKQGYGALTTIENALNIKVVRQLNADTWQIHENCSAETISWDLIPPAGAPIIGSGVSATVSFEINSIVTTYQPGPTVMLVTYRNVPGYQDGVYTIVLNKIAHVVIKSFSIKPNPTYAQANDQTPVTVSWEVDNATALTLYQNYGKKDIPVTDTSTIANLEDSKTSFTLTATGPLFDQGNQASVTQTAIALPVINSFTGTPTEIYCGDSSHQGEFAWAVATVGSGRVKLSSTGSAFRSGLIFDPVDSTSTNLTEPQMITLSPQDVSNPLSLTRNLVISAFQPAPCSYNFNGLPHGVAASPGAPFIAVSDNQSSQVVILNTVDLSEITRVAVGKSPARIVFSADGSTMIVSNTGDCSLTPVTVALTAGHLEFTPQSAVTLDGSPQGLIVSPKGDEIFVVLDMGKDHPGQLAALKKSGNTYHLDSTLTVGVAPRGLAALQSGAAFYVANSGSNSVSVASRNQQGKLIRGVEISAVGSQPADVALAADDHLLLVVCTGDNKVTVIDQSNPNVGRRQSITVGTKPVEIAVMPSGSYAFVSNAGDGTLSLLSCWGSVNDVKVLGQPITVGTQPSSVAVTPDGLNVLSANNGAKKISVVALQTYQAAGQAVSLGNQMTNVAVAPDAKQVFVWQNPIQGFTSTPGIIAYSPDSSTQQGVSDLGFKQVVSCVFSPVVNRKSAYVLARQDNNLYTINTITLATNTAPLLLPSPDDHALALSISGDGNTLFVASVDSSSHISLLCLRYQENSWQKVATIPLYQAQSKINLLLLQSSIDGMAVLIVDRASKQIREVRAENGKYELNNKIVPAQPGSCAVTILPDGSVAYVLNIAGMDHAITKINMATLESTFIKVPQSSVELTSIVSSPDGRRLYASDANSGCLRILDPASLRILQTIPLSSSSGLIQNAIAVAISSDAASIYVVGNMSANMSIVEQVQMK